MINLCDIFTEWWDEWRAGDPNSEAVGEELAEVAFQAGFQAAEKLKGRESS
jgi:hypothetical protein